MGMGKLREPVTLSGVIPIGQSAFGLAIVMNSYETVWVIEQIAVGYDRQVDTPQVSILRNGVVFSGAAQMLPGAIQGLAVNPGLAQTFAGVPYMYMEADTTIIIQITNGTAGATVSALVQFREISYADDELVGRF